MLKSKKLWTFFIMLMVIAIVGATCTPPVLPTPTPSAEIESVPIPEINQNLDAYLGQTVIVRGFFGHCEYFGSSSYSYLVTDYTYLLVDEPLPRYSYLCLEGDIPTEYDGYELVLEGIVSEYIVKPGLYGDVDRVGLIEVVSYLKEIIEESSHSSHGGLAWSVKSARALKELPTIFSSPFNLNADPKGKIRKFAVILSGGINDRNNHPRYWNGVKFTHDMLTKKMKIDKADIFVAYYKGTDRKGTANITDYKADKAGVGKAFNDLSKKIKECKKAGDQCEVMIFTTNHGEERTVCLLGSKSLLPIDLVYGIGDIRRAGATKIWVTMAQCYSGLFIINLGKFVDGIATASTKESYVRWDTTNKKLDMRYSEFYYHFISALNGADPTGAKVNADTNKDGTVSWKEAFDYAKRNDYWWSGGLGGTYTKKILEGFKGGLKIIEGKLRVADLVPVYREEWHTLIEDPKYYSPPKPVSPPKPPGVVITDAPRDVRREDTRKIDPKGPEHVDIKRATGKAKSFDWTIELAGEVPMAPEWPTLYKIVLDSNNDPSDNDNDPEAGVFNGDLIYWVAFYPEVPEVGWGLRRFVYDAESVIWYETPTGGIFSIEGNVVNLSISESEIGLTFAQEALPFRVVAETEMPETLFWDVAPDEGWADLAVIALAETETD